MAAALGMTDYLRNGLAHRAHADYVADFQAPVAQLDRASDYESEGRTFESFRARQFSKADKMIWLQRSVGAGLRPISNRDGRIALWDIGHIQRSNAVFSLGYCQC